MASFLPPRVKKAYGRHDKGNDLLRFVVGKNSLFSLFFAILIAKIWESL